MSIFLSGICMLKFHVINKLIYIFILYALYSCISGLFLVLTNEINALTLQRKHKSQR